MIDNTTIELRSYNPAATGSLVFNRIWRLRSGTDLISGDVAEAYFVVLDGTRKKMELSLGNGLTWNADEKSILIQITNEQVAFIRADAALEYSFYVVWQHGDVQTIREGALTAVKVS